MKTLPLLALALTLLLASTAAAAPADLDPTFSQDGVVALDSGGAEYAHAIAVEPNGHILVAGVTSNQLNSVVYRLRSTGTPDPSFNKTGQRRLNEGGAESLRAVVRQPDGKILLAGRTDVDAIVYRLNGDGTLDKTFNKNGRRRIDSGGFEEANAMLRQPDGKILVAGATSVGGDAIVYRLNANGTFDTTFNGTGTRRIPSEDGEIVWAMARQADGKIVLATGAEADLRIAVYRLNANGSLDTSFGTGGRVFFEHAVIERVRSVAIQPDGKIVLGGELSAFGNALVYRLNTNGSLDTTFDGTGRRLVTGIEDAHALLVQPDGRVVIAGSIALDAAIARLNPDGSADTSFDGDGVRRLDLGQSEGLLALARQPNGRLLAAGWTTFNDNATVFRFIGGEGVG